MKHHDVRIDGKAHDGFRLALTASVVNRRNEITKRGWFFVVRFHISYLSLAECAAVLAAVALSIRPAGGRNFCRAEVKNRHKARPTK